MSNNRKKVSISVDLIPQIYELSAVKCLNAASTIALVLKIFKEVTPLELMTVLIIYGINNKVRVYMPLKAFQVNTDR